MKFKKAASIVLIICIFFGSLIVYSQVSPPQKDLTVTMPLEDWNAWIFYTNNRNVKGVTVTIDQSILEKVIVQLNKQLSDSTTNKKK